jgi:rRNA maturation protein Nop10
LKKCQKCGSFCLDASVACGMCGAYVANTPTLRGSIEDEVLRDRREAERQSSLVKERIARWSKRRLVRRLLMSITAIAIGSATVISSVAYYLSRAIVPDTYGNNVYGTDAIYLGDLVSFFVAIGGFTLVLIGLHLSMKGGTSGSFPTVQRGGPPTNLGINPQTFSGVSNLAMRATYEGTIAPRRATRPE